MNYVPFIAITLGGFALLLWAWLCDRRERRQDEEMGSALGIPQTSTDMYDWRTGYRRSEQGQEADREDHLP